MALIERMVIMSNTNYNKHFNKREPVRYITNDGIIESDTLNDVIDNTINEMSETIYKKGIVNTLNLNFRKEQSVNSDIICILKKDNIVEILDEIDEWYFISFEKEEGFVKKEFIEVI
jgi:uncharacterized protein YgiM (DUF1202 family)